MNLDSLLIKNLIIKLSTNIKLFNNMRKILLMFIALLSCVISAQADSFEVGGIWYNALPGEKEDEGKDDFRCMLGGGVAAMRPMRGG